LNADCFRHNSVKILPDHGQRPADEVAVAVGEVGVITLHQCVEREAAVLTEDDLAQQEIAQRVGSKHVKDGLCANDIAARLRHFALFEEQPAMSHDALRQWQSGGHENCRPVDAVEAGDLLADDV